MASEAPDYLELPRHRDWEGRRYERFLQNTLFALLCVLPILALFNVFGQNPSVTKVTNPHSVASLELSAPEAVHRGLIWHARIDIRANKEIKDAVVELASGWLDA